MTNDTAASARPSQAAAADRGDMDHLALIAEMSREFAESQDIHATICSGLTRIAEMLDAEAASLFLLDADGETLTCSSCCGPVDVTGLTLAAGDGIVGRSVSANCAQIVREAETDPDFQARIDAATGFTTRSILCAPMTVRDERLGAVELLNKRGGRRFDESDRQLLEALAASAGLALYNARLASDMLERARIKRELELAARIQRGLLPAVPEADLPVHGVNVPVHEVSGDFFDIVPLADGRVWFNVGDVSGKGLDAAMLMAKTSSLFAVLAKMHEDPAALVAAIDRELSERPRQGMFVTFVAGLYDPASGRLDVLNAGHEPALVLAPNGDTVAALPAAGPPLGLPAVLQEDGNPFTAAAVATLWLGQNSLYVFTDGLTEARGPDGALLGSDGVRRLIARHAHRPAGERLDRVMAALRQAEGAVKDDLTLLVVDGPWQGPAS